MISLNCNVLPFRIRNLILNLLAWCFTSISEENEYKGEVRVQVKRKRREEVNIFFY